jgi:hypothetical protein
MNDKQAREVATKLIAHDPPGTEVFLSSEGMANASSRKAAACGRLLCREETQRADRRSQGTRPSTDRLDRHSPPSLAQRHVVLGDGPLRFLNPTTSPPAS